MPQVAEQTASPGSDFLPLPGVDYVEFTFSRDGDFFLKDNIKVRMATLHPRGIQQGPHPKALAVGERCEWRNYSKSWGGAKYEPLAVGENGR